MPKHNGDPGEYTNDPKYDNEIPEDACCTNCDVNSGVGTGNSILCRVCNLNPNNVCENCDLYCYWESIYSK